MATNIMTMPGIVPHRIHGSTIRLVPLFALLTISAVPLVAADGDSRNFGLRVNHLFMSAGVEGESETTSTVNGAKGPTTTTSNDYDAQSVSRTQVAFSFYVPADSTVGFNLSVGPALTAINRKDDAKNAVLYGAAVEPGVSLKLAPGLRLEIGIPLGFGVGVDSYHWSVTNEDYDVGALYYEAGINVRPSYTFDFGLELFAQAGYLTTTWTYQVDEEATIGVNTYKTENTIDQTVSGLTYGAGAGFRW